MKHARINEVRVFPPFVSGGEYEASLFCSNVEAAVRVALDEKGYIRPELPSGLCDFSDLFTYSGEWKNGGHETCINNIGDLDVFERASQLLARLGLVEFKENLDRFTSFCRDNAERIDEIYELEGEAAGRQLFYEFDDRFWEIKKKSPDLDVILQNWLVDQPWIVLDTNVPKWPVQYYRETIEVHPLKQARKEAVRRERVAENLGTNLTFWQRVRDSLGGST
jgi:hypothetical protein